MWLNLFILDSRRVLHPVPTATVLVKTTSQIKMFRRHVETPKVLWRYNVWFGVPATDDTPLRVAVVAAKQTRTVVTPAF